MISRIQSIPKSRLIEHTAAEFACIYYEVGRGQGMTSKFKTPQAFARANLEKFIPMVMKHFLEMLNNPSLPKEMKEPIFEAMMERHNDPTLQMGNELPDIDVNKLIELTKAGQGNDATQDNVKLINTIEKAIKDAKPDYQKQLKQ